MANLFRRILDMCPRFDIHGDDPSDVYMRRHKLFLSRWCNVYLHEFFRGDVDRCLHDHPWRFVTVVLAGGYREHLPGGESRWRPAGTVLYRPATFAHRVEVPEGRRAWSLVIVGPRVRQWGFFARDGWRAFVPGFWGNVCE